MFNIKKVPCVQEIPYGEPWSYFQGLDKRDAVWLDSAMFHETLGRYSYIAYDPIDKLILKDGHLRNKLGTVDTEPFQYLEELFKKFKLDKVEDLPSFQGGLCGFISYDLGRYLEKLPNQALDDQAYEDWILGVYDLVLAFDHALKRAWIFSTGIPEIDEEKRIKRAQTRMGGCFKTLLDLGLDVGAHLCVRPSESFGMMNSITSSLSESSYIQAVERTIEYIKAGDIFEANIAQRFITSFDETRALELFLKLRKENAATFAAFVNFDETKIISASPERFLKVDERQVETRPIKGTRRRSEDPIEDKIIAEQLKNSEKDRAENIMIVDLMRNDLSRVCKPHSVHVPLVCGVETYATVHHLVSSVTGTLQERKTVIDLLKAAFPGGSITGAPKIRAMEIIESLETYRRGPYCGSVGFFAFNGDMDLSIQIRGFVLKDNVITYSAGGAVLSDSSPQEEYQESLLKAQRLTETLFSM